ncbi:UDP-N-acetylglucosamine 1-carboxyvinyltransferase [Alicycliphilus sp. B1]|nr:UDP-N-acetylglucosamine 1-carboxyvinyltransferase [Alicycliphilus sp. B1]
MGARIEGHGTSRIRIQGCGAAARLHTHQVVADRIEAGTFLCAVAAAGGEAFLRHARADHLDAVIDKLLEAGARVAAEGDGIRISSPGGAELKAQSFTACMQAQFMALNVVAPGGMVAETIFENRFMHVNDWRAWARRSPSTAAWPR